MTIRLFGLVFALLASAAPASARDDIVRQGDPRGGSPESVGSGKSNNDKTAKTLKAPVTKDWYDRGMAAIRDKDPGLAVDLMKPLLDEFDKRYAEEKRHIYCALNPAQSKAYLVDASTNASDAVTIEPDWCRAQYVRGYALIDLGKLDEALVVFRHLTALAPRNSRYLNELAYVLGDKKNYKEAAATYQRAVAAADLSPDGVDDERCIAYRGLGYNLTKLGRLGEAETAYRACLKIDPGNAEVIDALESLDSERKDTV